MADLSYFDKKIAELQQQKQEAIEAEKNADKGLRELAHNLREEKPCDIGGTLKRVGDKLKTDTDVMIEVRDELRTLNKSLGNEPE